ncbi:MBL fold metallo-hydrolase [Lichenifustis flavocetrariae]|uniref:MBL fold metallo-hydrolase n=1 Tax=Lichenifustis flavocetrariae TaxID=2949735 RepID=A0AA41YTF5_9HYPH|nr:MBL fold metallo-hydrolase [Lichenifustis flavocetrariae]MCW6508264.1 MBL fold metallo-hydrolase [Lichenifustis flavocetrariae]
MAVFLCTACGTSFPEAPVQPERCPICEDERQYVPAAGQGWTTHPALEADHRNAWRLHEPGLMSVQTVPTFAIGQRAFLLRTPSGNILWDCISLLDPATEELVRGLGGLAAIAISHPHYYTTAMDWAATFDASLHLHAADRAWVVRPDPRIRFWSGETLDLLPGVTLIRAGGHFAGGTALHWADTADGAGTLLPGDIVQVAPGGRRVSFMRSYPNMLPLPATEVRRIAALLAPWRYARIYGVFAGLDVVHDGPAIVARSAARYAEILEHGLDAEAGRGLAQT